jgi:hypothetical protein
MCLSFSTAATAAQSLIALQDPTQDFHQFYYSIQRVCQQSTHAGSQNTVWNKMSKYVRMKWRLEN